MPLDLLIQVVPPDQTVRTITDLILDSLPGIILGGSGLLYSWINLRKTRMEARAQSDRLRLEAEAQSEKMRLDAQEILNSHYKTLLTQQLQHEQQLLDAEQKNAKFREDAALERGALNERIRVLTLQIEDERVKGNQNSDRLVLLERQLNEMQIQQQTVTEQLAKTNREREDLVALLKTKDSEVEDIRQKLHELENRLNTIIQEKLELLKLIEEKDRLIVELQTKLTGDKPDASNTDVLPPTGAGDPR